MSVTPSKQPVRPVPGVLGSPSEEHRLQETLTPMEIWEAMDNPFVPRLEYHPNKPRFLTFRVGSMKLFYAYDQLVGIRTSEAAYKRSAADLGGTKRDRACATRGFDFFDLNSGVAGAYTQWQLFAVIDRTMKQQVADYMRRRMAE